MKLHTNDTARSNDLDLAEEKREVARVKLAAYQQKVGKGYNKTVRMRTFCLDDLVLKKVTNKDKKKKLKPNWDGPYRVIKKIGQGAYQLEDMDGKHIDKPWNAYTIRPLDTTTEPILRSFHNQAIYSTPAWW